MNHSDQIVTRFDKTGDTEQTIHQMKASLFIFQMM